MSLDLRNIILALAGVLITASFGGCSGATPGFMTPSKPQSGSADPTMDPFEREGARHKETPSTGPSPAAPAPRTAQ